VEPSFQYSDFVATTQSGLETVCAAELEQLGATDVLAMHRAVRFKGDKELMYRTNYCSRTALRILKPLAALKVPDADAFYKLLNAYPWEKLFSSDQTFAIEVVGSHPSFTNTVFAVQRCKDAIVDRFRKLEDKRPSVDLEQPDIKIHIHLQQENINVSLDSSGEPLFKRGYRKASVPAPLNEVLAAGLIMISGWDKKKDFYDPFCGSGTIPIEAALIATATPPGFFRKDFGFIKWGDFDETLWNKVKDKANALIGKPEARIFASDNDIRSLNITRRNLDSARMQAFVKTETAAFADRKFNPEPGIIIANPPYGERLRPFDLVALYKSIGDTLKRNCAGYEAWIIGSDMASLKYIGLKPSAKFMLNNGPLECRFLQYKLFSGSRKEHLEGSSD
jgi:putative N6-adenine-specific DNA methylase